jgi:transcriptional regulator with XRE-family HTH domain
MAAPLETLPNRIRQHRKAAGLTLEELGEKVGLSKSMVGLLERGLRRVSDVYMRRIAATLGVSPADLLHPDDNPYALTEDEKRHLDNYRQLDAVGRRTVANVAENLREWTSTHPEGDDAADAGEPRKIA